MSYGDRVNFYNYEPVSGGPPKGVNLDIFKGFEYSTDEDLNDFYKNNSAINIPEEYWKGDYVKVKSTRTNKKIFFKRIKRENLKIKVFNAPVARLAASAEPGAPSIAALLAAYAEPGVEKPGVSIELWNANPSWANQQANETMDDWIDRLIKKNPPKGTNVDVRMYGVKSRKSKKSRKSSYRAHKQKYSICKMDPSILTVVQSRKRRSVCKGAYKKAHRKF